ncbi:unnamed protein product [Tilletia controversa]|nr:unnamed protein product [Tilletia controversa]
MPLHLAQHKSYHPYNEKNKERVRKDEEQERLRLETEERQRHDAESDARIEALRRTKDASSGAKEGSSSRSEQAARQPQHINFFEDLEAGSRRGPGSQAGPSSSRSNRHPNAAEKQRKNDACLDRVTRAHALGGPTVAEDRQPWYSDRDLQSAADRKRSTEQKLKAARRDSTAKSQQDPMKAMHSMLAKRKETHEQRDRARTKESPYREPASPALWTQTGDYSDQFNRDAVREARKRKRGSSPTPDSHRRSLGNDGNDRREGKRRARDDPDEEASTSPRWRESRFSDTYNQGSSSRSAYHGQDAERNSSRAHEHSRQGGTQLSALSDMDLPGAAYISVKSPPSTAASSSEMAFSFPPCGQALPPPRFNTYSHEPTLPSSSATSLDGLSSAPVRIPSSSFDDIKREPDSDDIPIADLVDTDADFEPDHNAAPPRRYDPYADSDVDSVSPSPPARKAESSSGTVFSGPSRSNNSSSTSISMTSPVKSSQQIPASPASIIPSIKIEPSSGQSALLKVQEEIASTASSGKADDQMPASIKTESQSQQLPLQPPQSSLQALPTLEKGDTAFHFTPEGGNQDDLPRPCPPLTLIDVQRTGLLPSPWRLSTSAALINNLMPPLTQSSEYDELAPDNSQMSVSNEEVVPPLTQSSEYDELAPDNSQMSVSNEEVVPPPVTPQRQSGRATQEVAHQASPEPAHETSAIEMDADVFQTTTTETGTEQPTTVEGILSAQGTEPMEEPERSQQEKWAEGIWRSQKFREPRPVVLNAFERMQMQARSAAAGRAPPKVENSQGPDDSGVEVRNVADPQATGANGTDTLANVDIKFRESMYPSVLTEMIDTVLEHEAFLFSTNEAAFLQTYAKLSYEARYLFSRLIGRKHMWHRVNLFKKYDTDIKDMVATVRELAQPRFELEAQHSQHVCNQSTADEPLLTRFAYTQKDLGFEDRIADMLDLLSVEELKALAKKMNILKPAYTTRAQLIEVLMAVKGQSTLAGPDKWRMSPSSSKTQRTSSSSGTPSKRDNHLRQLTLNFDLGGNKTAQSSQLKSSLQSIIGDVIYVPGEVRSLIDRLALVYYRGNAYNGVGKALTQAVLARCGRRNYPEVEVRRSDDIFKSRDQLKRYERACAQEYRMVLLVDGTYEVTRTVSNNAESYIGQAAYDANAEEIPAANTAEAHGAAIKLFEEVFQEWKDAVAECEVESPDGGDRITYHRMRFHPGWPLTRIMYKAGACFSRVQKQNREKEILRLLLGQKVFCQGRRGEWYDRLALLENRYCTDKVAGARLSLQIAVRGIEDPDTHFVYKGALEARIKELETRKSIKVPFKERHHFGLHKRKDCETIQISGVRLDRMLSKSGSSSSLQAISSGNDQQNPKQEAKQKWTQIFSKKPTPGGPTAGSGTSKIKKSTRTGPSSASPLQRKSPDKDIDTSGFVKRAILQKEVTVERVVTSPGKGKGKQTSSPGKSEENPMDAIMGQDDEADSPDVYEVVGMEIKRDLHTVWRGLDNEPCRVEQLCLQHFEQDGFKGVHDEGGVLTMLFVLAMWDVIYMPVEGAFETRYQSEPLDMRSDAFAIVRKAQVRARLHEIEKQGGLDFIKAVDERERPRQTCATGCNWDKYSSEMLIEVADCLGGLPLSMICQMLCEERQHCQSGMPDLCIWKVATKEVRFVEVKGPGDKLREKQKVWIDILVRAGATVQVAQVSDKSQPSTTTKRESGSARPAAKK